VVVTVKRVGMVGKVGAVGAVGTVDLQHMYVYGKVFSITMKAGGNPIRQLAAAVTYSQITA